MFTTTRIASALSPAIRFEVKWFYRKLLRRARALPEAGAAAHYEEHFKAHWLAHEDETDETRIREILERAEQDADWIENKYAPQK